ncbi:Sec-independent protein translocase protein TatB [Ancylobacter sp.]|uniref:Sec-independent protein translocase protein TatB n=1 Tax=Ancylobacter sp. TaxID=1872567 RepID=UPI003D0F265C
MFDIGWTELLVIGVVALVVIGPNELPRVLRTVGQSVRKLRRMAGEFQGQFNEALREAELSDLKDSVSGLKNDLTGMASDARNSIAKAMPTNPLQDIESDLKAPTGSVEAGASLPAANPAEAPLPAPGELHAPGDLEPHPFETVEQEVRAATEGLDAVSATAALDAVSATAAPSVEPAPVAPRPQTAAAPVETKAVETKAVETKPAGITPVPLKSDAAATPKPGDAAAQAAPAPSQRTRPAVKRAPRKPVAPETPVAEPEIAEAVASLDGAPPDLAPPVKRPAKPRVKAKAVSGNDLPVSGTDTPVSGNEGPAS